MRSSILVLFGKLFWAALLVPAFVNAEALSVERLTWAGVKLSAGSTSVFVDPVGTDLWNGHAPQGLVPVASDTERNYALITHVHNDHFDVQTLKAVLGERGFVICHEDIASYVASRGLRVIPAKTWTPVVRGDFVFTAVPAVDGLGDAQVSWVIRHEGKRLFHGGDTLWHGAFGGIGKQFGPFDLAFLPINGARINNGLAVHTGAVMTPLQAVDAARLLGAKVVVPIHYGLDEPPDYIEVEKPLENFLRLAAEDHVSVQALRPGEKFGWRD